MKNEDYYYGAKAVEWRKLNSLSNLELCFIEAKEMEKAFIGIEVEIEGYPLPEYIINSSANIESKLAYYKETYNENLEHKYSPGVKIVNFSYGDLVGELYEDLMDTR